MKIRQTRAMECGISVVGSPNDVGPALNQKSGIPLQKHRSTIDYRFQLFNNGRCIALLLQ